MPKRTLDFNAPKQICCFECGIYTKEYSQVQNYFLGRVCVCKECFEKKVQQSTNGEIKNALQKS